MATINLNQEIEEIKPEGKRLNSERCIQLLDQWLADESGYDEENWPTIQKALENNRTSSRPLLNE